jgi:hypothetical protein
MPRNHDWDDDNVSPTKGSRRPTEFLVSNFRLSAIGSVFRTVKAKFPPETIHAEARKAGVRIQIEDESPWLKVTVVGKLPAEPIKPPKKPDFYTGAGQVYSDANSLDK